jgi:hypothetical protein
MKTYPEHDASFDCRYAYRRSSGKMIIHEEVDDDELVCTPALCERTSAKVIEMHERW